jgi:NitT/TauT family transport system substrate-binding protein
VGNTPEAVEAFKAGALDWICTIEPYATSLLQDVEGSHMLSDGKDLYGPNYTDCVLVSRNSLIEENRGAVKALIKAMMKSQLAFENETQAVLDEVVGTYYKTSMENAVIGSTKQPPMVDQRMNTDFILGRTDSLIEMGYIKQKPDASAIDWSMLEEVIDENPDIYDALAIKSV